jgi:hypothetical protein
MKMSYFPTATRGGMHGAAPGVNAKALAWETVWGRRSHPVEFYRRAGNRVADQHFP